MSEARTNRILKVPYSKCTVRRFYDLFLAFLQEGEDGWELMRNRAWPYGAILKVPNWKDGEYGYAGLMYDEVRSGKYRTWLTQHDVFSNEFVHHPNGLNVGRNTPKIIGDGDGHVSYGSFKETTSSIVNPKGRTFSISPGQSPFNYPSPTPIRNKVVNTETIILTSRNSNSIVVPLGSGADILEKGDLIYIKEQNNFIRHQLYADAEVESNGIKLSFRPRLKDSLPGNSAVYAEKSGAAGDTCPQDGEAMFTLSNISGTITAGTRLKIDEQVYQVVADATADQVTHLIELNITPPLVKPVTANSELIIPYPERLTFSSRSFQTGSSYVQLTQAEIFNNAANVIYGGMFKQYEAEFDWNELMTGTDRPGIHTRHIRFATQGGPYNWRAHIPTYPGEGWPVLAYAPDFFSKNVKDTKRDFATLFFTRTKHNAALIVNFREFWDVLELGFFEPFASNHEYAFPAMVVSSNSGMRPTCTKETDSPGRPYIYQTNMYDYTDANISFGHAMPNYAAADTITDDPVTEKNIGFTANPCSQVQAIVPAGYWQGFSAYTVATEYYYSYNWGKFYAGNREPAIRPHGGVISCIWPSGTEPVKTINNNGGGKLQIYDFHWTLDTIDSLHERINKRIYNILPVFLAYTDSAKNATGYSTSLVNNMIGIIPGLYWCTEPVARYGIYHGADIIPSEETGKRLYLVMPNCREGRKYHIINSFTALLRGSEITQADIESWQKTQTERLEELSRKMNTVMDIGTNIGESTYSTETGGNAGTWYENVS